MTPSLKRFLPTIFLLITLLALGNSQAQVPAVLPMKSTVPATQALAIDGVWMITNIGKRIRIEAGRAWAVDSWLHMVLWRVQPEMVVIQNIERTGDGVFEGDDLPLMGRMKARLKNNALEMHIAGALGPVQLTLTPESLDDERAYRTELARAGRPDTTPIAISPPPAPRPEPVRRPPRNNGKTCGVEGLPPCAIVPAKIAGKAEKLGCPGKSSYFSTLEGGSCWTCPDGYKRASVTRRMDHKKACRKEGSLTGPWTRASFEKRAWGCPGGQFHVALDGGTCMTCPTGYKRIHAAGIDTMKCRPDNRCEGSLRVAKQPPEKNPLANLIGASSAKVCAPPFDIKAAAKRDKQNFGFLANAMTNLATELFQANRKKKTSASLKSLLKAKRWRDVYDLLDNNAAFRAFMQAAKDAGHRSISVGWAGDVQLVVGSSGEIGIAIDLVERKLKPYESAGISKGLSIGIDGALTIGVWNGPFETGYAQGFTTSVSAAVSVGAGIWYSYYSPEEGQEHLLGMTVSAGAGLGTELGEYNEVGTFLLKEVFEQL